jgi:hypothetical protein
MVGLYLVMCLQHSTLQWHALTSKLHYTKQLCVFELLERAEYRKCRCEVYVIVLEQRGED